MPEENINIKVQLIDNISRELSTLRRKVDGSFSGMGQQAQNTSKRFAGVGDSVKNFAARFGPAALATAGLTAGLFALGKGMRFVMSTAEQFESTMSRATAILVPTTKEMAALEKQARELGKSTVFSASQAGEAFLEMGKLGLQTNEIIAASEGVLNLAAIAQTSMAESATTVSETLAQFGLVAEDSTKVVDIMAKSFNVSALDMNKFSESMKFVGPVAKGVGETLESTTAALATLAKQGISGSMAGTGFVLRFHNWHKKDQRLGKY